MSYLLRIVLFKGIPVPVLSAVCRNLRSVWRKEGFRRLTSLKEVIAGELSIKGTQNSQGGGWGMLIRLIHCGRFLWRLPGSDFVHDRWKILCELENLFLGNNNGQFVNQERADKHYSDQPSVYYFCKVFLFEVWATQDHPNVKIMAQKSHEIL